MSTETCGVVAYKMAINTEKNELHLGIKYTGNPFAFDTAEENLVTILLMFLNERAFGRGVTLDKLIEMYSLNPVGIGKVEDAHKEFEEIQRENDALLKRKGFH